MTEQEKTNAFRDVLSKICNRKDFQKNIQNVHTPYKLCGEMLSKLNESVLFTDKIILTFNLEFVEVLCYDCQVKKENIWFITDCPQKAKIIEHKRFNGVNVVLEDYLLWSETTSMKFDIIVGNPPYNTPREMCNGKPIWPDFVKKSLSLLKEDGYLCFVHPSGWRKPEHELWSIMISKQIHYLKINSKKEGQQTFGCKTRYDWYILQNITSTKETEVVDENEERHSINLKNFPFLPNSSIKDVFGLLPTNNEEKCKIIRTQSYNPEKSCMSDSKSAEYKYPIVNKIKSKQNGGPVFIYSNVDKGGGFGTSKVIFNLNESIYCIKDYKGKFSPGKGCFAIQVDSKEDGENIINAITSSKFKNILDAITWEVFQLDYRAFKYFKKDFWKEFII